MSRLIVALCAVSGCLLSGCAGQRAATISCDPSGATVLVDGVAVGSAPLSHTFDFDKKTSYHIEVQKAGYFDTRRTVTSEDQDTLNGEIRLAMIEDESWTATAESRATNTWLRMEVDSSLDQQRAWQIIIDAVTTRYSSLEQLDASSGYCRSSPEVRTFKHPKKGNTTIRTQIIGAVASAEPLVYKFKIVAEESTGNSNRWTPYNRVFKDDATMIEELSNRLSIR